MAIDQAPVSAGRICAQTFAAVLKVTDTDDLQADAGKGQMILYHELLYSCNGFFFSTIL